MFNERFPRRSDDLDIFVEDLPVAQVAAADMDALRTAGLEVELIATHYGFAIEAAVRRGGDATLVEWSEADRKRFFPIQPHPTFGWTLHEADLAVQKLAAASTRRVARDAVDLLLLDSRAYELAILAIAVPGKLEGVSPVSALERALRTAVGHREEDYVGLRLEPDPDLPHARDIKLLLCDRINVAIDRIVDGCPTAEPGLLYLDAATGVPVLPTADRIATLIPRAATEKGSLPQLRSAPS